MCVCVLTGLQTAQFDQIMRWWSSSLGHWSLQSYNLLLIVMYFFPAFPATIVITLSSTWGNSLAQTLPVSVTEYPPTARGQPLTRASPVSILSSQLPYIPLYPPLVPTAWISVPVVSNSLLPAKFLPGFPKVFHLPPPRSTIPLSCIRPLRSPSILHILQISVVKRHTAPRFPVVSLCRSSPTAFQPLPALIPPRASHMSCPLAVTLISLWCVAENTCVFLLPSDPLPLKVPKFQIQKVGPLVGKKVISMEIFLIRNHYHEWIHSWWGGITWFPWAYGVLVVFLTK